MFIKNTDKQTLLKPLQLVIGIVERKQTLPILSNVLIERENNQLRFTATDLEIQITTSIEINTDEISNKSLTVAGKKLQEILKILPEQSRVSIESKENNKAQITSNKSRFNLHTLPAQDFPKFNNQLLNPSKINLPQKDLKSLLLSVQYAMAQQDVRYYLNGVLLIIEGNQLKAIATDGHRLAFNLITVAEHREKNELILPRKAIIELCKLLNNDDEIVQIEFSSQQVKFEFSGITIMTKVIDGKFPDYERVIPKYNNNLLINRIQLQQALQRAAILSNEKFKGIRFVLTEQKLTIISSNNEQEEAQEEIDIDYHGEAIDIGFNVNYLMDGIINMEDENITVSFGDANSSILMTLSKNSYFRYVVMPMRI